ncbi:MAG TPA: ABC transporter ATP-binding protein, partial [Deinococcales bacterium]|nr:ABC transporter ATP-binding protein [Deinococcales bacterium]
IARQPEVYLFDDSFSALDYRTDARLRAALRDETRDSSIIIVAQRISTVVDADQIIVLDDGRAVGIGTHRELMATSSVYREIVQSQLGEKELA